MVAVSGMAQRAMAKLSIATGHAMQIYNCLISLDNCKFALHDLLLCLASPLPTSVANF